MEKKTILVGNMNCMSCERLIESELKKIKNIRKVEANYKEQGVEIGYVEAFPEKEVQKTLSEIGHPILSIPQDEKKNYLKEWIVAILIAVAVLLLFRKFQSLGWMEKINPNENQLSYWGSFLMGIIASFSSCLAVVGSVVIIFSQKYRSSGKGLVRGSIFPNLLFQSGRILTFFVLGAALGLIGQKITLNTNIVGFFALAIALLMLWMGLDILDLLPQRLRPRYRTPAFFDHVWEKSSHSGSFFAPFIVGGLTFFLPCGFTQSAQLFALSSGSWLRGGLTLFLFAMGTFPVLFLVGSSFSHWNKTRAGYFSKFAGILVVIFAFFIFSSSWAMIGIKAPEKNLPGAKSPSSDSVKAGTPKQVQIVEMKVTSSGFEPAVLSVKKDIPVQWIIIGEQVTGCTSQIIIPKLGIAQKIQNGRNVINFTPTETGPLNFSCWMGMVRGKFIVN